MMKRAIVISIGIVFGASFARAQAQNDSPWCSNPTTQTAIDGAFQFIADQQGRVNMEIFPKLKLYHKQFKKLPSAVNGLEILKSTERQLLIQLHQNKDYQSVQSQIQTVFAQIKASGVDPNVKMTAEQKKIVRPLLDKLAFLMIRRATIFVNTSRRITDQQIHLAAAQAVSGADKAAIQWVNLRIQLGMVMLQQGQLDRFVGILGGACDNL